MKDKLCTVIGDAWDTATAQSHGCQDIPMRRSFASDTPSSTDDHTAAFRARIGLQDVDSLQKAITIMDDGLLLIDAQGKIAFANLAARRLLGVRELPLGSHIEDHLRGGELQTLIHGCLNGGEHKHVTRELNVEIGESSVVILVTITLLHDENKGEVGLVVAMQDVTSLKHDERSDVEFVRIVTHELRAPLGAIRGYLDVMLQGLTASDEQKEHQMLERMRMRTDALLQLVDDLLLMSRLEKAGPKRDAQLVPLREQVEEALDLFAAEASAHHIRLHLDAGSHPLCVLADPAEVQQIITNLVSNAIKYNRPGGSIEVAIDQVDGKVKLSVEDTGLGIAADAIPELGKEFHRIKTSATRDITGTGLGLSIVKRITEKYGGHLSIRSREGEGSTFAVYLPRAVPAAQMSRPVAERSPALPAMSHSSIA